MEPQLVVPGVHLLELEIACFGRDPPVVGGAGRTIRALAETL